MRPQIFRFVLPALLLLGVTACATSGDVGRRAGSELKAGVDAAKNGYWREAKFRFEKALELDGTNGELWNNLAVAHEALGEHEAARSSYERAKELLPSSRNVTRNFARFEQFYSSFVAPPERPDDGAEADATDDPEGEGNDDQKPSDPDRE